MSPPPPPPPPPSEETAPSKTSRSSRRVKAGAGASPTSSLPAQPDPADVRAALARVHGHVIATLRGHGLTGVQRVKLTVDGATGRVQTVWVLGKPAGHAACGALQRVLRAASMPRASRPYTLALSFNVK